MTSRFIYSSYIERDVSLCIFHLSVIIPFCCTSSSSVLFLFCIYIIFLFIFPTPSFEPSVVFHIHIIFVFLLFYLLLCPPPSQSSISSHPSLPLSPSPSTPSLVATEVFGFLLPTQGDRQRRGLVNGSSFCLGEIELSDHTAPQP